jgi:hypothetical protein
VNEEGELGVVLLDAGWRFDVLDALDDVLLVWGIGGSAEGDYFAHF